MSLVVSEVSRHGIVMVGDSAVTTLQNAEIVGVRADAAKIQYTSKANVGIAMWGCGQVGEKPLDSWIAAFLESSIGSQDGLEIIGQRLAQQLNGEHEQAGRPWSELVCGFHLAGFKDALPRLWHVHCGHANEPAHELRLYHDYPEDQGWTDKHFRNMLENGFCGHLRNGYHPHFAALFDSIERYSDTLRKDVGINFPQDSLKGRLYFYKLLVQFVAGTLIAAGEHPGVNNILSAIAFDQNGLVFDEQISVQQGAEGLPEGFLSYF